MSRRIRREVTHQVLTPTPRQKSPPVIGFYQLICLKTEKGYWTGFTFVDNWKHKNCKFYRTRIGAERAQKWLSKHHRITFYITYIHKSTPFTINY